MTAATIADLIRQGRRYYFGRTECGIAAPAPGDAAAGGPVVADVHGPLNVSFPAEAIGRCYMRAAQTSQVR